MSDAPTVPRRKSQHLLTPAVGDGQQPPQSEDELAAAMRRPSVMVHAELDELIGGGGGEDEKKVEAEPAADKEGKQKKMKGSKKTPRRMKRKKKSVSPPKKEKMKLPIPVTSKSPPQSKKLSLPTAEATMATAASAADEAKKASLGKRLVDLAAANEKLKKAEMELSKENAIIKGEQNLKELEVERLLQYWTLTKQDLAEEQERTIELERRLQRLKSAHIDQVSLLHKRICMLQLTAQAQVVSGTQTDPFGADSDCSGKRNAHTHTVQEWSSQKAHDSMRAHDDQLVKFISEMEHSRLQSQIDFRYAVAQSEQKLRQEHEAELRIIKEDKERQLEDIAQANNERLMQVEMDRSQIKTELSRVIVEMESELEDARQRLSQLAEENITLGNNLSSTATQLEQLKEEYHSAQAELAKNACDSKELKKSGKMLGDLRTRLEKIEEISEILLGEFKAVEVERNALAERLNVPGGGGGGGARNKAAEFGRQLDDVRRRLGGINLF